MVGDRHVFRCRDPRLKGPGRLEPPGPGRRAITTRRPDLRLALLRTVIRRNRKTPGPRRSARCRTGPDAGLGRLGKLHVRQGKAARGPGPRERMVPLIIDAGGQLNESSPVSHVTLLQAFIELGHSDTAKACCANISWQISLLPSMISISFESR
jgi:hypothetical protein